MARKAQVNFPLPVGKEVKMRLGDSFNKSSVDAYHKVRYDFKPASFSSRKPGSVEVGSHRNVTMKFTNPASVYVGSTQPTKDCVMIIEEDGTVVLEQIWSNINLKQDREASRSIRETRSTEAAVRAADTEDNAARIQPQAKRAKPGATLSDSDNETDGERMGPVPSSKAVSSSKAMFTGNAAQHDTPLAADNSNVAPDRGRAPSVSSDSSSGTSSDTDSSSSGTDDSSGTDSSSDSENEGKAGSPKDHVSADLYMSDSSDSD